VASLLYGVHVDACFVVLGGEDGTRDEGAHEHADACVEHRAVADLVTSKRIGAVVDRGEHHGHAGN